MPGRNFPLPQSCVPVVGLFQWALSAVDCAPAVVLGRAGGPSRWPGCGRDARVRGLVQADLGTVSPLEQAETPLLAVIRGQSGPHYTLTDCSCTRLSESRLGSRSETSDRRLAGVVPPSQPGLGSVRLDLSCAGWSTHPEQR